MLYGYQGADREAEKLALTDHLLDAAFGELSVVARSSLLCLLAEHSFDTALGELGVVSREQPCLVVGDFNVEPTKSPCLAKGISAGLG